MDESFARKLDAIDWFRACGQPLNARTPFAVSPVGSWAAAIEVCSDQSWEDTTLEAQNRLTSFLHAKHRNEYRNWNSLVIAVKERVVTRLADQVWRPFAERHELRQVFVDCVSWDVLAAIMEHEYRACLGRPEWFLQLLRVYEAGHFPCGWSGEWPGGSLFVY